MYPEQDEYEGLNSSFRIPLQRIRWRGWRYC